MWTQINKSTWRYERSSQKKTYVGEVFTSKQSWIFSLVFGKRYGVKTNFTFYVPEPEFADKETAMDYIKSLIDFQVRME